MSCPPSLKNKKKTAIWPVSPDLASACPLCIFFHPLQSEVQSNTKEVDCVSFMPLFRIFQPPEF